MSFDQVMSWWSFVFLGVVVYMLGEYVKDIVRRTWPHGTRMRALYDRTVVMHPVLAATLIALVPGFPMPDGIPTTLASKALFGVVAGISCSWSYKAFKRVLGRDTRSTLTPAAPTGNGEA